MQNFSSNYSEYRLKIIRIKRFERELFEEQFLNFKSNRIRYQKINETYRTWASVNCNAKDFRFFGKISPHFYRLLTFTSFRIA